MRQHARQSLVEFGSLIAAIGEDDQNAAIAILNIERWRLAEVLRGCKPGFACKRALPRKFWGRVTEHFNWADIAWDPYVEFRQMDYRSSSLCPLASGLTGTLTTVAPQAAGIVSEGFRWQTRLAFYSSNDAAPWFSYNRSPRRGEGPTGSDAIIYCCTIRP